MDQICIQGGIEKREKCYVILLINKIICIPFHKLSKFKHTYSRASESAINDCTPDIKWFANLCDCSFKSVPSYFLQASQSESTKSNRTGQSLSISITSKFCNELFVINETCVTNIEPYVVQEERYLVADKDSVKDHEYWSNSFQIAQRYTLYLQMSFVNTIADQITALEQLRPFSFYQF